MSAPATSTTTNPASPADVSRGGYIEQVLTRINADPTNSETLIVMLAWMMVENSRCNWNPYGNSRTFPGSKQCRYVTTASVQEYPDKPTGEAAMASEIEGVSWVTDLAGALRSPSMTAEAKASVIGMAGWNTGPNRPTDPATLARWNASRAAYAAGIVAHCATVRPALQTLLPEPLPGSNTNDPSVAGAATALGPSIPSLSSLTSWTASLGKALAWIGDAAHWWQIGRVALGVVLVGVGLVLVFKDLLSPIGKIPGLGSAVGAGAAVAKGVAG